MELISTHPRTMPPGPFSQAYRHNGLVYVSGQISFDGALGKPVTGDIRVQTRQALKNLKMVLESAGSSFDRILKLTCVLPHFADDYVGYNEAFKEFFPGPIYPARTSFQGGLLGELRIEIEAIAVCDQS